jgi:hypothetical protein
MKRIATILFFLTTFFTAAVCQTIPQKQLKGIAFDSLAYNASITWDLTIGFDKTLVLRGNANLSFLHAYNGATGTLIVVQDGTGGHELTVPDQIITINTDPGDTTVLGFVYNGSIYFWATSIGGGGTSTLPNGDFFVGNASNVATAVAPSGDVTFNNVGAFAIGAGKVTNTMLAGSIDLTTKVTGILPSANGGTGVNNGGRTITINTNSGTFAFSNASKTVTFGNSITFNGTDATVITFPTTSATMARTDAAQTFTGIQTFSSAPVFSTISNTGTLTLPTVTGTLMQYTPASTASSGAPAPTGDAKVNELYITAQAASAAFAAPSGSLTNGNILRIRIKDNGTARALTWDAIYVASPDLPLPSTTILGKTMYLTFAYNSATPAWNLVGMVNNFGFEWEAIMFTIVFGGLLTYAGKKRRIRRTRMYVSGDGKLHISNRWNNAGSSRIIHKAILTLLLAFSIASTQAQTRFYFDRSVTAPITFTPNAAWNTTAVNTFVMMYESKTFFAQNISNATITSDQVGAAAPRKSLMQTYISRPMNAQTILSGVTFSLQMRITIASTASTTGQGQIYVRLCNEDGTNLREIGNAQSTNLVTTITNRTITVTAGGNITVNNGDRLVIEIGGNESVGSVTTRTFSMSSALGPATTDLPVDNTTTTANNAWFECSQTLLFRPIGTTV